MLNFKSYTPAKAIAHVMVWHGDPSHVGFNYRLQNGLVLPYDSANLQICQDQCARMKLANIDGINVDWYGPANPTNDAAVCMLSACEEAGLSYSLCVDQGAIQGGATGTQATSDYVQVLDYAHSAFFSSPAYLKDAGRNVVSFFGEPSGVNWTTVRSGVSDPLAMIFQSNYSHPECDGCFGWVSPTTPVSNINLAAIQAFNAMAAANPGKLAFYPVYPGFDDSLAAWGSNRAMTRGLGKTLVTTLRQVPSTARYILISTFNDWEENSGIEEAAFYPQ